MCPGERAVDPEGLRRTRRGGQPNRPGNASKSGCTPRCGVVNGRSGAERADDTRVLGPEVGRRGVLTSQARIAARPRGPVVLRRGAGSDQSLEGGRDALGVEALVAHLLPQAAETFPAGPDVVVPAVEPAFQQ